MTYIPSLIIIAAYLWFALTASERSARGFHWANALCGIPLAFFEIQAGAYFVLVLTLFFTVIGWIGVIRK